MAGFTTTPDGDWVFDFADPQKKPTLPQEPTRATSYLEGPGKWENYSDDILYEVESLLRQFFESKMNEPHWTQQHPKYRRYTAGMMFEVLYGRKCTNDSEDLRRVQRLSKLMAYYATRKQSESSINGKRKKKPVYTLSLRRYKNLQPYSLKLRISWLEEQGKLPVWQNMRLPKDNLETGHSRYKKTDENMERRRERARARYNERYNKGKQRAH